MKLERIAKTGFLDLSFLAMGAMDSLRGPTLLDFRDFAHTTVARISYIFPAFACGSIAGGFLAGYLLDKFPRKRYLIFGLNQAAMAITTMLLPVFPSLWVICLLSTIQGIGLGALDAGGTVLCMNIWSGSGVRSDPYVHSVHFSFGLGAFVAPLVASFFVENAGEEPMMEVTGHETPKGQLSSERSTLPPLDFDNKNLLVLFAIFGLLSLVSCAGFIYFHFKANREGAYELGYEQGKTGEESKENGNGSPDAQEPQGKCSVSRHQVVVSLLTSFIFFYVGLEVGYGTFIPTFAVLSPSLALSRQDAALVSSVFWGGLAATRLVAIFVTVAIRPTLVMAFNFAMCFAASVILLIKAHASVTWLCVGSGLMGIGMATMFASGFLWLQNLAPISNRVGAIFSVSGSLGADIVPLVIGQFISTHPDFLIYLSAGCVLGCIVIFGAAYLLVVTDKKKLEKW